MSTCKRMATRRALIIGACESRASSGSRRAIWGRRYRAWNGAGWTPKLVSAWPGRGRPRRWSEANGRRNWRKFSAEQQALKVSILDLSAALALARRERELEPRAPGHAPESDPSHSAAERMMGKVKERAHELEEGQARAKPASKKRGMFEGLQLRSERSPAPPASASRSQEPSPQPGRTQADAPPSVARSLCTRVDGCVADARARSTRSRASKERAPPRRRGLGEASARRNGRPLQGPAV